MCGRFYIGEKDNEWDQIVSFMNRRSIIPEVKLSGEIFPTDIAPVLAPNRDRIPSFFPMRWGYSVKGRRYIINARSETAAEKPMFIDGIQRRRCAVPASRYFEWTRKSSAKQKYSIRPKAGGTFYLAGLYRFESDMPVFTILTRAPSESVAFLHDRMPVLLCPADAKKWVEPDTDVKKLLDCALLTMECTLAVKLQKQELPLLDFDI